MPGKVPSLVNASLWQTPQADTLIRTVPGSGSGTGRSTISKGPFGRETWATRMVAMTAPPACRSVTFRSRDAFMSPFGLQQQTKLSSLRRRHCFKHIQLRKAQTPNHFFLVANVREEVVIE